MAEAWWSPETRPPFEIRTKPEDIAPFFFVEHHPYALSFLLKMDDLRFLNKYGHGGFFFEFLGYGLTGNPLFVRETLKQRENGLPEKSNGD